MNANTSHAKIYDTPEQFPAASTPARPTAEFEIEGELEIGFYNNQPCFLVDNCHLAEFVMRHFGKRRDCDDRSLGKMKIIIVPIWE